MTLEWTSRNPGVTRCSILDGKVWYVIRDGSLANGYCELEITERLRFRGSSFSMFIGLESAKMKAEAHANEMERYGTKIGSLVLK